MKAFKFFILTSIACLLLSSCEKENCDCDKSDGDTEKEFQLTAEYIKQTIWKGKIWYEQNGKIVNEGYINVQFSTDKRGTYELKYNDVQDRTVEDFQYQISDKLFVFTADEIGRHPRLRGDWLIKSQTKSKIVMVQNGHVDEGVSEHIELNLFEQ